jgi:hypothetical protein
VYELLRKYFKQISEYVSVFLLPPVMTILPRVIQEYPF